MAILRSYWPQIIERLVQFTHHICVSDMLRQHDASPDYRARLSLLRPALLSPIYGALTRNPVL